MNQFCENLNKIINKVDLGAAEMSYMINEIFAGRISDAQTGAFMAALSTKGETFEELAGAARAMRSKAVSIRVSAPHVIDTCGTGGDGTGTFNISTTTAFVVAGCGVTVAKHGNRSVSSRCGSADLLEKLGVKLTADPRMVEKGISKVGIGFLFAPLYHNAMRFAARARKEIGIRSIFNMIGPLTNPAGVDCQLIGVYASHLTEMFAQALNLLGSKQAFVVYGHDGLDEISICAPTRVTRLKDGSISTFDITPEEFFNARAVPGDLAGGDPEVNAEITKIILAGEKGPRRDVVVLNASFALVAAGKVKNFTEGILLAGKSIDSGSAMSRLENLISFTQENA